MNLNEIRDALKAPKNQYNSFGKYKYRSCEDILEAVKPLLGGSQMWILDEVVQIGLHNYVKATINFNDGENVVYSTGYAKEPISRKGMDASQITGCASSYARKYALNGLFLIDDTKDADTMDNSAQGKPEASKPASTNSPEPVVDGDNQYEDLTI